VCRFGYQKVSPENLLLRWVGLEKEVGLELTEKLRVREKKWLTGLWDVLRGVGAKMQWQVIPEDWCEMMKRAVCYFES